MGVPFVVPIGCKVGYSVRSGGSLEIVDAVEDKEPHTFFRNPYEDLRDRIVAISVPGLK